MRLCKDWVEDWIDKGTSFGPSLQTMMLCSFRVLPSGDTPQLGSFDSLQEPPVKSRRN